MTVKANMAASEADRMPDDQVLGQMRYAPIWSMGHRQ